MPDEIHQPAPESKDYLVCWIYKEGGKKARDLILVQKVARRKWVRTEGKKWQKINIGKCLVEVDPTEGQE